LVVVVVVLTSCLSWSSAGTVSSTQELSNETKALEKEASGGKQEAGDKNPEVAVVADDNIQTTTLVQISTVKSVEIKDDRVVRVNQSSFIDD